MRWLAATAGALAAAAVGLTVGEHRDAPVDAPESAASAMDAATRVAPADGGATMSAEGPAVRAPDAGASRVGSAAPQSRAAPRVHRRGNVDYVGDPPGLRLDADAGVAAAGAAPPAAAPDAGTQVPPAEAELKRRIQVLEQQVAASREQVSELQRMNEQLASLRQQLAESEQARQEAQREAQQRKVEAQQAVSTLYGAQQALANGNGDILDTLSALEPSLPASAQREIESARAAIASGDFYAARMHVAAAITATQQRGE
jgi:Skp family chaperone for outer membrane proteins